MESNNRLLIFDVTNGEIVAGAYIGEKQESVLRVDADSDWEAWLEEFISDHLATGPCTGVGTNSDPRLTDIAARLKLDLQFIDRSPLPAAIAKLYPGRDAIVVAINDQLLFTAIQGDQEKVKELALPSNADDAVKTIQQEIAILREKLTKPVIIATGRATSDLTTDSFSSDLRLALAPITDAIEPELVLIGTRESLIEGGDVAS